MTDVLIPHTLKVSTRRQAWNKTEDELIAQGYRYKNSGKCRGCQAAIQWWTTPAKKNMPLDPSTLEPHWGTCPEREQFKKKRSKTS
jgi:hypothetical protein